ncbi:hypothetical protein CV770_40045 [Bradyrhizobium sp. AC87j1]|nr:hypothetical protein CV770_40045 [Bradyrhizobium sp. AC87j1]
MKLFNGGRLNGKVALRRAQFDIGLSIAHAIVEAHGGRIGAENVPSGGAVFHVSLPLAAPR